MEKIKINKSISKFLVSLMVLILVVGTNASGIVVGEEVVPLEEKLCANLIDDDGDGYIDCEDSDCDKDSLCYVKWIRVDYPNGGETVSGTVDVAFYADKGGYSDESVDVYYSKTGCNPGSSGWHYIGSKLVTADGTYHVSWDTTGDDDGSNYCIGIADQGNWNDQDYDTSDDVFTVSNDVSITVVAHKIVCDSESDLPNWGGGGSDITSSTAQDYVDKNPNCHFEQGWDFEWSYGESNPGDNSDCVGGNWNEFGPTDSNGMTSVVIGDANSDTLWFRECLKTGYVQFSDSLGDSDTAEFYCDGDVLNYDNYDFIDETIEDGDIFYCVAFNALESVCEIDDDCEQTTDPCYVTKCIKGQCVDVFEDNDGPVTSNVAISPEPPQWDSSANAYLTELTATETEDCTNIKAAEYFVRKNDAYCGPAGMGDGLMDAVDTSFDSLEEDVIATLNFSEGSDGYYWACVRGQNANHIWEEDCTCVPFGVDTIPPDCPTNIQMPELICADDEAILTAEICDSQSNIQAAKYYFDRNYNNGFWMDAVDGQFEDDRCEEVTAIIDYTNLDDGCHLLELHGKDTAENWGKLPPNFCSSSEKEFILDREAPTTTKTVGDPKRECTLDEKEYYGLNEEDGCYYITTSTEISFDAVDPEEGCNSDNVVTKYRIRWKEAPEEDWPEWGNFIEYTTPIILTKDSMHEIEYYSVDSCGNEEDHHYELDIVDTKAPISEKVLGTPKKECTADEKTMYGIDDCWYVTDQSLVELSCEDQLPHPVGDVTLYYKIDWKENWDDLAWIEGNWNEVGANDEFQYDKSSFHKLTWYCEDALGNTEEFQHVELDIVDAQAPDSHKILHGDTYFVDAQNGMPTNMDELGYFIWEDTNGWHIRWKDKVNCPEPPARGGGGDHYVGEIRTESGIITNAVGVDFEDEIHDNFTLDPSGKLLTFDSYSSCGDSDGIDFDFNGSFLTFRLYYNDDLTDLSMNLSMIYIGENKVNPISMPFSLPFTWVTQGTEVELYCNDLEPHPVGGEEIYYKVWYKENLEDKWDIPEEFTKYDGLFGFDKDSYHLVEFYCVDELGNEEVHRYEVDYVDTQAPKTWKVVGTPKVKMDECCDEQTEICDYWVTTKTPIDLYCEDVGEHPSDNVVFEYRINGGDWIPYTETIYFDEDCSHTLEWKCEDALGNTEGIKLENDNVDTKGPTITKWVDDDTVRPGDTVKICAEIIDLKGTSDSEIFEPGVGVNVETINAWLELGDDPESVVLKHVEGDTYCGEWTAPIIHQGCHDFKCVWELWVEAEDLLGNYNKEDGIEIIVDNAKPELLYVLNPPSGRYYRDGRPFDVYIPAIDFGGDPNIYNYDNCKASGVYECTLYAVDYPYEDVEQSNVKNYWDWLLELYGLEGVFTYPNPEVVELGSVPYVDGVCKGNITFPKDSGITDKAFLAYKIEDNAGNWNGGLAWDMNDDLILIDMDNEGPDVAITDSGNTPGPLTIGDTVMNLRAEIFDSESGFNGCFADVLIYDSEEDTGINLAGQNIGNDVCEINDQIPAGLESGYYWLRISAVDGMGNVGYAMALLILDNDRPEMGVVSPEKNGIYGDTLPVSLYIEDEPSSIVSDTVLVRLHEMGIFGSDFCLFGCEDTGWIELSYFGDGYYSDEIDLTSYGITGDPEYNFDAIACDSLYNAQQVDEETGLPFVTDSRNNMHCRRISIHGADEYEGYCGDGIITGDEQCEDSEDCSEGYNCENCMCVMEPR